MTQAVSLGILGDVARHGAQYALGLVAHHSKFEDEGGVEYGVGVFLIGEYPSLLTAPYARPASDGG